MDDYEKYEKACNKIKKDNERLLHEFAAWLKSSKISDKTINKHRSNIDFYINEFLLYQDAIKAKDGVDSVDMFLGYWFIKKAMWANESEIKGNAGSLKKFYTFMFEKGLINKEQLADLKDTIKNNQPKWLETMQRYADLSIENVWEDSV
jgi:site-specific recombinase XerD